MKAYRAARVIDGVSDHPREAAAVVVDKLMASGAIYGHGEEVGSPRLMVDLGATPMQAIRFATAGSADLLGVAGEVGTLEAGRRADLLAVAGDPLTDIHALADVRLVLRDGTCVWGHTSWTTAI